MKTTARMEVYRCGLCGVETEYRGWCSSGSEPHKCASHQERPISHDCDDGSIGVASFVGFRPEPQEAGR